jgi:hypothetical protein
MADYVRACDLMRPASLDSAIAADNVMIADVRPSATLRWRVSMPAPNLFCADIHTGRRVSAVNNDFSDGSHIGPSHALALVYGYGLTGDNHMQHTIEALTYSALFVCAFAYLAAIVIGARKLFSVR